MEDLVELESRRCRVKAYFLARSDFVIAGPSAFVPSAVVHAGVAEASHLVFNSQRLLVFKYHLFIVGLGHNLFARVTIASQQTHSWSFGRVGQIEAVRSRTKN